MKHIPLAVSLLLLPVLPLGTHAHGITPELQALFILASVSKCKIDQPTMATQLDASSSIWEQRNRKHVLKLREMGDADFEKAIAQAREAYDSSGTFTFDFCESLSEDLKTGSKFDVKDH